LNEEAQLAEVGVAQAQSSYYYRMREHNLFDSQQRPSSRNILNWTISGTILSAAHPALALDTAVSLPGRPFSFRRHPHYHHQQLYANILFVDGHAVTRPNNTNQFTVM